MRRLSVHWTWLLVALGAAAVSTGTATAARSSAATAAAAPAQWRSFDLLVDLQNLPRAYTCDELWYRFRDLLLAIGARPYPQILAYQCGTTPAQSTRSPSVQLQFELPDALPASDSRYADVSVVRSTIRLAPGRLASWTKADCELLKQVSSRLLVALPVRVVGTPLECAAPGAPAARFALEVQALIPRS
jgi:hypothetical protein